MINNAGLELIKKYEGFVPYVYKCPAGVKTAGYGHTGADVNAMRMGQAVTKEQAEKWLLSDVEKAELQVRLYDDHYHFNENQYSALVSFAFNIGNIKGLTNYGKRTIEEIKRKIPEYVYAGGVRLTGLIKRRNDELTLFNSPVTIKVQIPKYLIGHSYKVTASSLAVRQSPSLTSDLVPFDELTLMGQKATNGKTSFFKEGTVITCLSKQVDSEGNIWILCPSGWLCAYYIRKDSLYIK